MAKKTYITRAMKLAHVLKHGSINTITEGPDYQVTQEQQEAGYQQYRFKAKEDSADKYFFVEFYQITNNSAVFLNNAYKLLL